MSQAPTIAFIGSYVPRRCGIATFTSDLRQSVAQAIGDQEKAIVVAVNDVAEGYSYGKEVRFEIREGVQRDYRLAAEYLNIRQVSAVCLQHEYGLFGGPAGSQILALLHRLRRPLVTTLHTVIAEPSNEQKAVLQDIADASSRLVVLSQCAGELLQKVYGFDASKVVAIPHGIPSIPFVDSNYYKDLLGAQGRTVLLTFGLLSPGKGIEHVIKAMPAIVARRPDVVYAIVGATHPKVRRQFGEQYRNMLLGMVDDLGLGDHVIFRDRFIELDELVEYLCAADMYITPYLGAGQVVSGALAYAMGAGKAVVSTPYSYASEMLAKGRGTLVGFGDSEALSSAVIELLDDENKRNAMRKAAYVYTRRMLWPEVARSYLEVFDEVREEWTTDAAPRRRAAAQVTHRSTELPEVDLRHMFTMTDDTGIFQHCLYDVPNREHGYCTDDNARALIAALGHWSQTGEQECLGKAKIYISFLAHALDGHRRRFRNFFNYDRTWVHSMGSEDSHGRALWALGSAVAARQGESTLGLTTHLFTTALPTVEDFASPRAWAFTLLGIDSYLSRFGGDSEVRRMRCLLGERLLKSFAANSHDDWPWCEDSLTYCNARLPHALIATGRAADNSQMLKVGLHSLRWLVELQTTDLDTFSFVGTKGWGRRQGRVAQFDQQPVEAGATAEACIAAYRACGDNWWIAQALKAYGWFLGRNDLRLPLVDFGTGGCRDGLHEDRVNENQGAESTLVWLITLLLMHQLQAEQNLQQAPRKNVQAVAQLED
jgi:glycosyltransferase involved in cell wall biosynthesis